MTEPICGAGRTVGPKPEQVAICLIRPSEHAGLDHFDRAQGVHWPVCETWCPDVRQPDDPPPAHICGRYRLDTA